MTRQIVLDTETTGLEPEEGHRVIEIGCVELVGRRRTGQSFHRYLNPELPIPRESTEIHGIRDEDIADCPVFYEVADELLEFLTEAELVIHNAAFDLAFLNRELEWAGRPLIEDHRVVDTLKDARNLHPGQKNDLDSLCARYEVDNRNREKHGALLDSELLADVFLAMTGGQEDLALAAAEVDPRDSFGELLRDGTGDHQSIPRLEPTTSEWQAHRHFLQRIQEVSGQCLWLKQEEDDPQ